MWSRTTAQLLSLMYKLLRHFLCVWPPFPFLHVGVRPTRLRWPLHVLYTYTPFHVAAARRRPFWAHTWNKAIGLRPGASLWPVLPAQLASASCQALNTICVVHCGLRALPRQLLPSRKAQGRVTSSAEPPTMPGPLPTTVP